VSEALDLAVAAARLGAARGTWVAGGSIAERLVWARQWLPTVAPSERADALFDVVGTSVASQESVVAALALVSLDHGPWATLTEAAGLGGDTDTIAAMAGAVLGALHGSSAWPAEVVATVTGVNDLHLGPLVDGLLLLRGGSS
jgi:ADP-ribosylglycohydrolase